MEDESLLSFSNWPAAQQIRHIHLQDIVESFATVPSSWTQHAKVKHQHSKVLAPKKHPHVLQTKRVRLCHLYRCIPWKKLLK